MAEGGKREGGRSRAAPPKIPVDKVPAGVGEGVWIDVIQKMDEVYHDLLEYEVALEEKNAALEESQRFIVGVLGSMSDVLVVCDRSGHIEDVNPSLVRLCGRGAEALRGTPFVELVATEGARAQVRRVLALAPGEPLSDVEVPLVTPDGGSTAVSLNFTPRSSAAGRVIGVVMTGRPVGELRRAYHELRRAHDDLKRTQQQLLHSEKMASLGRLVAGVAHELNNPISFVLGNVHALRRYADRLARYIGGVHDGRDGAELDRLREELRIDRILGDLGSLIEGTIEGAERTRDIVDGLKRFSAVDRDAEQRFDLVEIVERAVRWVRQGVSHRFEVELSLPPKLPVIGSAGQIHQVMMNLVQNACDATLAQPDPRLVITARTVDEDRAVELTLCDNGPGIDAEHLGKIFDPFFTTKPVGKGTGLGLSISYGIVERHGGTLSADNAPGGGARFVLRLPLAPADDVPAASPG